MISKINNETSVNGRENWTTKGLPPCVLLYLLCLAQGWENNSSNDKWQKRDQNFEHKSKFNEKNNYEGKVDLAINTLLVFF